jgi:hypothetical protein
MKNFPKFSKLLYDLIESKKVEIESKEMDCKRANADRIDEVGKLRTMAILNLKNWEADLEVLKEELEEFERVEAALNEYLPINSLIKDLLGAKHKPRDERQPCTPGKWRVDKLFIGNIDDEEGLNDN